MSILIVESPAKCKKIQSFLDNSYIVKSSVGHIRTLDTRWANTDVKITDDFEPPFIPIKDKHEVISNLKSASKGRKVILAADLLFTAGAAVMALAPTVGVLMLGRFLVGLGVGVAA